MKYNEERQVGLSGKKQALLEARLQQRGLASRPRQAIEPRRQQGPVPLSFAQQRLWFLQQLEPETAVYNIPRDVRLLGPLSFCMLERALAEVIQRHESLRTTFQVYDDGPLQVIHPVSLC